MTIPMVDWRQPGRNYDPDKVSLDTATDLSGVESATFQSLAPATEIDNIMARFHATGEMPRARHMAEYGDFDDALDLQGMLQQIKIGEAAFRQVPASIRGEFDNEPGKFLEWIHDERNHDEAVEMGLLPKPPAAVPVVAPAGVPAGAGDGSPGGVPVAP